MTKTQEAEVKPAGVNRRRDTAECASVGTCVVTVRGVGERRHRPTDLRGVQGGAVTGGTTSCIMTSKTTNQDSSSLLCAYTDSF